MGEGSIREKLHRIRGGEQPRVLDMFSGCGGLTLGFVGAGCVPLGSIEVDAEALRTYSYNFHGGRSLPKLDAGCSPMRALAELGIEGSTEDQVDILVGGPPCPTFSRIGRAKINVTRAEGIETILHPNLFGGPKKTIRLQQHQLDYYKDVDDRNELYRRVLEYAEVLRPVAILIENVPGFLNQAGTNHAAIVAEELESLGYDVHYSILNAADFGVPQWRERFFLVAIHRENARDPWRFPRPTHSGWRPDGIRMNRLMATSLVEGGGRDHAEQLSMFEGDRFQIGVSGSRADRSYVTAEEALSDLPSYMDHRSRVLWTRDSSWDIPEPEPLPYSAEPEGPYARRMRDWTWPGCQFAGGGFPAHHHVARHTMVDSGRDVRIFERMEPGSDYRRAFAIAVSLFEEARSREQEKFGGPLSKEVDDQLRQTYVPPYPTDKFPHKWWKLDPDQPARTLTAHMGVDSYSHIHYDDAQARMITVQEAARLQSFPDRFVFRCGMNAAMRQIGNSVPPLVAEALARAIIEAIRGTSRQSQEVQATMPITGELS